MPFATNVDKVTVFIPQDQEFTITAMSTRTENSFVSFLSKHDDKAWADVVASLLPSIHEVDRNATEVWFGFFPVVLARALAETDDVARLVRLLNLQGTYRLADQIDTSHRFFYGHRYWPQVKKAVAEYAATASSAGPLAGQIRDVAATAAKTAKADVSLVLGVTAVAFMTLQQTGFEAFSAASGTVRVEASFANRTPEQVLKARKHVPGKGIFGFLRTVDRSWTVTFDETRPECTFASLNGQDLSTAGSADTRDYQTADPRCVEGPIPVECRTAACGTCWIGVLHGAENLTEVDDREWRKMKEFGYLDTDDPKPALRLACRARTHGPVSIVVPPWNGVFGKLVEGKIRVKKEEEPATTTA